MHLSSTNELGFSRTHFYFQLVPWSEDGEFNELHAPGEKLPSSALDGSLHSVSPRHVFLWISEEGVAAGKDMWTFSCCFHLAWTVEGKTEAGSQTQNPHNKTIWHRGTQTKRFSPTSSQGRCHTFQPESVTAPWFWGK